MGSFVVLRQYHRSILESGWLQGGPADRPVNCTLSIRLVYTHSRSAMGHWAKTLQSTVLISVLI